MKKVIQVSMPVIQGFVLCAVALQIVLGAIYIGSNFMTVPQFRDTVIYLEMAEKFVVDEYTGILYPLIVKFFSSISMVPFQVPIYLMQIAVGLFCVYHFVCSWTERKWMALVCALWVNTIPFVAQAHVTVLPHSLVLSLMLLMFLQVLKGTVRHRALRAADWAELLLSYFILTQLGREYLWPGMLFVIWAAFLQFYTHTNKMVMFFVSLLICLVMFVSNLAVYDSMQTPGYYGRMQRSFSSAFFQRVGVNTLNGKYMVYMPDEISQCFSADELNEISQYPYKIKTEFGPTLEARYGAERANELYMELGKLGLGTATKDNLVAIAEDTVSYAMPLGMYTMWQDGELKGATSWNYQQFLGETPVLASAYARICHCLWLLAFGVSVTVYLLAAVRNRKLYVRIWLPVFLCACLYAFYFALGGADTYDYKLALLPMVLSYAPICCLVMQYIFKEV